MGNAKSGLTRRNLRKGLTFVIIIFIFVFVWAISSPLVSSVEQINQPLRSISFEEPLAVEVIPNSAAFIQYTDIAVDLNITYPMGILIVNEKVSISATAFLNVTTNTANVTSVWIGFQNALASPINYQNGIPLNGILKFNNPYAVPNSVIAENNTFFNDTATESTRMNIVWNTDGDYEPIIQLNFYDGSSRVIIDDSLVFHVYPQSQLTQIETNKVNTLLTVALFVFGIIGSIFAAIEIWPREPTPTIVIQTKFTNETHANHEQNQESNKLLQSQQTQNPDKKENKKLEQKNR